MSAVPIPKRERPALTGTAAHTQLCNDIREAFNNEPDVILRLNPNGNAISRSGHPVTYGLGKGTGDIIGSVAGRFCSLEAKTGDAVSSKWQRLWADLVRRKGGFACEVRSVQDARAALDRCRAGRDR